MKKPLSWIVMVVVVFTLSAIHVLEGLSILLMFIGFLAGSELLQPFWPNIFQKTGVPDFVRETPKTRPFWNTIDVITSVWFSLILLAAAYAIWALNDYSLSWASWPVALFCGSLGGSLWKLVDYYSPMRR